jgi:DNA-3-methyladenine glycosylase I
MVRCSWCGQDPLYMLYHDTEWGVPVHDDDRHFEFLLLETQQAGLSWRCILGKRDGFRRAYEGFDPRKIARFDQEKIERLIKDAGVIRNRKKIEASIKNAQAFLATQEEFGSFDKYIWSFVDGSPVINHWDDISKQPTTSPISDSLAANLKARAFSFIGSTTMYAHMQAIGMVNDHLVKCFRWRELGGVKGKREKP